MRNFPVKARTGKAVRNPEGYTPGSRGSKTNVSKGTDATFASASKTVTMGTYEGRFDREGKSNYTTRQDNLIRRAQA